MHLLNLTLSRPSAITCAIVGSFSAPKVHEIVAARGQVLELLRPDESGRVQVVHSTQVFGLIRSLAPFRFPGSQQDYVICGSDSGRVVILQYSNDKNCFQKVHQETYGKSGCRRIVPGEHMAVDPKGRACMIAAVEKAKFVYVLNRDNEARLTISSPLEAHKGSTLCYALTGLDVGFDNPTFAAIELDYGEADQDPTGEAASEAQKHLTLYELDLGLNHVVRKSSEPIDNGANMLIPVPGAGDGPGGVIVCAENFLIYRAPDHPEVKALIPRRTTLSAERGVLIIAATQFKQKSGFYIFVQSEYGDLYRVTLDYEGEQVKELKVRYFDTIPPCQSLCLMRKGFLFGAAEFGDHGLYQILSLGDDDTETAEASSATLMETEEGYQPVFLEPRALTNLELVDRMDSLAPITDMKVANLSNEEIPQIYAACGRGARSTLRVLRPGLAVTEMAVSPLPGNPTAVWTIKRSAADEFDAYIVVSFSNATLVLSIGETVEEVSDSGFNGNVPTLQVQLLADDSMLQIYPGGLRHMRPDRRINEWRAPGRKSVAKAATNERQVAVALSGGEILYFELNPQGMLVESEKREMGGDVSCLGIAPVPEGRQRSRFLAVGMFDGTARLLGLDPDQTLKVLGTQAVGATPESVLLLDSPAAGKDGGDEGAGSGALFLQVGLVNGVLLRTEVDKVTGQLSDTRTRFLGTRPPKLFAANVRGERSMLALSSRPWLGYSDQGKFQLVPMSYEALDYAAGFCSEQVPEGFVAVAKNTLRVIALERLGEFFNQQSLRLRYTPRKFVIHPDHKVLVVAEADHAAIPLAQREDLQSAAAMETDGGAQQDGAAGPAVAGPEADEAAAAREDQWGAPKGEPGQWASCVRVVDPVGLETTHCIEMDQNEAALSVCLVSFDSAPEAGTLLAVGTAQGLKFYPKECENGYVRIYRFLEEGRRLELVHRTAVEGVPAAMAAFKGRLLVGVDATLRLFDLGKKRLLRKCEYRRLPTRVATLSVAGSRVYAGDGQESMVFLRYKKADNQFYAFADDIVPRHITAALHLDYDTMAGADRFGNVFISRLPPEISAQVEEDPTGGKYAAQTGILGGAPNKLQTVNNFHVGEAVMALQRAVLQPGGRELIVYGTINGAIGVLYPFTSREDCDFFQHLEMHMRQEHPPLLGRDHLAYRSFYFPVKDVVDGDLCEQFPQLPADKARGVAEELDRSAGEVLKKLEDMRNRIV
ncbi:splicing factor 3B subunit 3-like [Micractinium conductrix]|uniref:Splicing factor 3B subunit 3-like n=1 Tax=Micractinium conductrix TaxID=554055 RepID=A0A2P6VN93_9CHLO|nr:splicing factor 3B subunit 3-like [Micractinium conductrix]|eukprot:PSC75527.1 splicing factor 3B subunit 3-like [Micractinium conductrix]